MPNRFTSKKTMLAAVVGALRRATGRGRITKTSGADVVIDCPSVKDGNRVKAALDRFGIMSMIGDTLKQRVVPYSINVMPAKKARRRNPTGRTLEYESSGKSAIRTAAQFRSLYHRVGDRLVVGEIVEDRIPPLEMVELRELDPGTYTLFGFVDGRDTASWEVKVIRGVETTSIGSATGLNRNPSSRDVFLGKWRVEFLPGNNNPRDGKFHLVAFSTKADLDEWLAWDRRDRSPTTDAEIDRLYAEGRIKGSSRVIDVMKKSSEKHFVTTGERYVYVRRHRTLPLDEHTKKWLKGWRDYYRMNGEELSAAPKPDDFAHMDSMGSRITRVIGPGRRPGTWRVEVAALNFRDPPTVYTVKWSKPLPEQRPRYPHFRVVAD